MNEPLPCVLSGRYNNVKSQYLYKLKERIKMQIVKALLLKGGELSFEELSKILKEHSDIKAVLFVDGDVNTKTSDMNTLQSEQDKSGEQDLETIVTEYMRELGIPAHIQGYQYIRTAIMTVVEDRSILNFITKRLYPKIAEQYSTTANRAERAIRHAIEVAWNRGNIEAINKVFGYSIQSGKVKPTNSEFIATIVDRIRVRMKNK